jgi:glycosyltransferase involved in cell wall biosynthesis
MTTKNVLHLVEYLYLGGIERLLEQIASNIDNGPNLFFFTYETEKLGGIGKQIKDKGFPVYNYKKIEGRDWRLLAKLSMVIQENSIDVVHTHDFGPMEYAVLLKIRYPRLRFIHTQHTIVHFVRNWKYTLFFQFASFFYCKIIAVSEFVKSQLLQQCPLMNRYALIVISNGVDTAYFSPINIEYSKKILSIVCISRVSQEKNFDYILNTCHLLKQSSIPFVLHHAGTSRYPQEVERIKDFIKLHGLGEDIILHGFVMNAKVVLDLGDIFVSSSKTEGHPVALLEAMSCEKLCFCSDIPAHRELAIKGISFFDINDDKSLYYQLANYYKTLPDTTAIRKIARNRIIESFSIQEMVKNYIEQYD